MTSTPWANKGVHDGSRIRPVSRFIIGLLCWISKASRTLRFTQLSSHTRILASCQLMAFAVLLDIQQGNSILGILVLHRPLVLCPTDLQCPPGLANCVADVAANIAEHSAQGIEYTTPFTSIISGISFTFVRDFLKVFLELNVVCTPNGLHILLIFSLLP